ncbi:MAG: hypothetical protein HPY68_07820 [Candidatus Atribacteria bacterium]|nr:hypothetical protein [Candidatus Atribacteria bacterium]
MAFPRSVSIRNKITNLFNPQRKAPYERLIEKGKPRKVILVAVANKLLRQAFAILKKGVPYDPHYLEGKRNFSPSGDLI